MTLKFIVAVGVLGLAGTVVTACSSENHSIKGEGGAGGGNRTTGGENSAAGSQQGSAGVGGLGGTGAVGGMGAVGGTGAVGGVGEAGADAGASGSAGEAPTSPECTGAAERSCAEVGLLGSCALGTQQCSAGEWGDCSVVPEDKDSCVPGNDDTCDGEANEACGCVNGAERLCADAQGNCAKGKQKCVSGSWAACSITAQAADSCVLGDDANCNGKPNEDCACEVGETQPCGPESVGICMRGTSTCGASGWGTCSGAVGPQLRDCTSSADNDCNGVADNTVDSVCQCHPGQAQACGAHAGLDGKGICKAGSQTCNAAPNKTSSSWGSCSGSVGPAARDCTSSADNDCNGVADNTIDGLCQCHSGQTQTCGAHAGLDGKGICKAGSQTCNAAPSSSSWANCSGSIGPAARNCASSADNDCNGVADNTIDNVCVCAPNAKKCVSGISQVCGSDGKWGNSQTCLNVCSGNSCGTDPKTIFVTSDVYLGALDGFGQHNATGPARADVLCQALADNANLSGTFKAWLSDKEAWPSGRFSKAGGPYQLPSGTVVANNWAGLTSGSLLHAINQTEWKDAPSSSAEGCPDGVWTNTKADGTVFAPSDQDDQSWCGWWTYGWTTLHAQVGSFSRADGGWSSACNSTCEFWHHLYCVQQ